MRQSEFLLDYVLELNYVNRINAHVEPWLTLGGVMDYPAAEALADNYVITLLTILSGEL
jgi:hypothetical protein